MAVREYFDEDQRGGGCPPGLAKKHDGCMPPGQAKRWHVGERLPRDVVFYDLPPSLVVRLTPPPMGYRYVRVDSDIVMLAVGTGLVAEAIEDLGRR
jgi:Ni/Co efflux regulator RcnB